MNDQHVLNKLGYTYDLDSSASTLNALREAALARLRPDHRWVSTDRPSKEG